ncbi:uncharacterized protein N7511_005279 [Penicillium nucicola]|uniref:uncharacterized protein n=1 Tax=Penicillium nucicola TaxID=1850975 RepID=UPI0025455530|nr:uncharacterized protein N7511_005279 [Penicillium nucicola]KAJ5761897.1 hypothetical protein N7511_005279 [Penicillium nucicola]
MARVMGRAGSALAAARRAPSRAVQRRARKHKVIMESVTQEKKKLRSVICFEAKAPSGYTFIPAGNPQLTTSCKERCRKENLQIYAVSTTPHARTHNLSQHVHRIGYHFPSTVVAAVCSELGLYLTSTGKTLPIYAMGMRENRSRAGSEVSQITLNTDARDAIKDLFPNIPDKDLNQIIKTAFQKGQKKVGTATELPMARRAQLAVVAHIRHTKTDYDSLLKKLSFHEARHSVEHETLKFVIEWRGDDENGQTVLEDVFREVIVISDDEDSGSEEDATTGAEHQSTRVDILPSETRAHKLWTPLPGNSNRSGQGTPRELSEEAPPGFRFVPRMAVTNNVVNRRGFSRYQAWNRAIQEYRQGMQDTQQTRFAGTTAENKSPRYATQRTLTQEAPVSGRHIVPHAEAQKESSHALPVAMGNVGVQGNYIPSDLQQKASNFEPNTRPIGLTNQESPKLQVLDKLPGPRGAQMAPDIPTTRMDSRFRYKRLPPQSEDRANAPVFVSGPNDTAQSSEALFGRRPDTTSTLYPLPGSKQPERILPSIETPWSLESRRVDNSAPLVNMAKRMTLRSVTPGRPQGDMMHHNQETEQDGNNDKSSKRRRLYHEGSRPEPLSGPRPIGIPVSEELGPRESYRRIDLAPEYRPQDQVHLRRNYLPMEQPVVGRQRSPVSYVYPQHGSHDTRPLDRQHIEGPRHHRSPPEHFSSVLVSEGDRAFRAAPAISNPGAWHSHGDRSIRMPNEPRARTRIDGGRLLPEELHQDRTLYADGFVRHVDIREPPPLEYVARHSGPEAKPIGDFSLPARKRATDYPGSNPFSFAQISPDQRGPLPMRPRMTPVSNNHVRTLSESSPGKTKPHVSPSQIHRPLSGGFISSRRPPPGLPPSSLAMEQNRPVYVQRVDPRPSYYPVPDGRPIVIVD